MQQSLLNRMKTGKKGFGLNRRVLGNPRPTKIETSRDVVEHDSDDGMWSKLIRAYFIRISR